VDTGRAICYRPRSERRAKPARRIFCVRGVVRPSPFRSGAEGRPGDSDRISKFRNKRVQVLVRDNNVEQALKALKKKMQREGIFREMKLRGHYEKPSEKKAREKAEAVRRARKLARKRAQREGLIAGKAAPKR
jgi:small subunit ribosomal protein S21